MIKNLFTSALFAGIAAGVFAAALQFYFVIPALLEGELYETGARVHFSATGSPESIRQAPGLGGEWARHLMTVAFNVVTYTGYGLLLAALISFAAMKGIATSTKQGLAWGLAGFVAVQLAPAIGLPPELPGTPAAEVGPRQLWWMVTIVATAAGLGLIAFGRGVMPWVGAVLILAPQVWGAPHLDTYFGVAPPELSAEFVTLSLGAAAAGWAMLGLSVAYFLNRFGD